MFVPTAFDIKNAYWLSAIFHVSLMIGSSKNEKWIQLLSDPGGQTIFEIERGAYYNGTYNPKNNKLQSFKILAASESDVRDIQKFSMNEIKIILKENHGETRGVFCKFVFYFCALRGHVLADI